MVKSLIDKVTIVTGGSRGIGASVATLFASEGAKVVICATGLDSLKKQADSIQRTTGNKNILAVQSDLSDESSIRDLFEKTEDTFGRCDVLVNNAAVMNTHLIEDTVSGDLSHLLDVNVKAPILCSKYAFKAMHDKGGSIINVSSLSGVKGVEKFPGMSAYVSSKFAIIGLTEALSVEGRAYNIRVNCVAPGAVDTPMLRRVFPDFLAVTQPSDIAPIFLFLADDSKSHKLTGEVIEVHCNS